MLFKKVSPVIILARPHHWIKNLFVFLPLFFALKLTNTDLLIQTGISFIAFSLAASAIYIINDLRDIDYDKQHPLKKDRPLASGEVKRSTAVILSITLIIISFLLSYTVNTQLLLVVIAYFALNIAYSFKLKNIAILDLLCISFGFILRLMAGSAATDIALSKWILLMTFLLSLFLALGKRRDDLFYYMNSGEKYRASIDGYTLEFVNIAMTIIASVTIVAYTMYTISDEIIQQLGDEKLFITVIWVIVGILRYFQLVFVKNQGGSPTKILYKDRFLQIVMTLWILTFVVLIY